MKKRRESIRDPMDKPNFPRWTIINFVEQLAEGTPMPGGGCAVAMVGALAAALGSLSGQISLKKETDQVQKEVWRDLQPQIDQAREKFLDLIDADALAYHGVVLARRLPHQNGGERANVRPLSRPLPGLAKRLNRCRFWDLRYWSGQSDWGKRAVP